MGRPASGPVFDVPRSRRCSLERSVVVDEPEGQVPNRSGVTRLGDASDAAETRLNRLLDLVLETAMDAMVFDAAYAANDGPCLDVLERRGPIISNAGSEERRWPLFQHTAEHAGIATSVSVHVPNLILVADLGKGAVDGN
jgi:hypothetical protein